MGVEVDEARRDHQAAGVDLARAALGDRADGGDPPVRHRDVAAHRLAPRAVADERAANHQIGHGRSL